MNTPFNPTTGEPYTGANVNALAQQATARGFAEMKFAGYVQWLQFGRQVKKGQKAIYVKQMQTKKLVENGQEVTKIFPRSVAVFAIEQTEAFYPEAA